jgi:fatty acid desaturase
MQSAADIVPAETQDFRQLIKTLSRVQIATSLYHLVEIWLVIFLAVYASAIWWPLLSGVSGGCAYAAAVVIIASRQHALMVLTHEGVHKRLSRTLWVNDGLARFVASVPVFISLAKWRFIHLYHHQYTHAADDPDRAIYARYPLASRKFFRLLLRDLCGLNVLSTLKYFIDIPLVTAKFNRRFLGEERNAQYRQIADMRQFALFWLVVLGGGIFVGRMSFVSLFGCYWLVPYCTLTQVFFRIRGAIEHGNVPDPHNPYRQTRTYLINPILAFFFSPKQVNYHLEHHLYPSVPFYNLPRLHQVLRQATYPREDAYCEPFATSLRKLAS